MPVATCSRISSRDRSPGTISKGPTSGRRRCGQRAPRRVARGRRACLSGRKGARTRRGEATVFNQNVASTRETLSVELGSHLEVSGIGWVVDQRNECRSHLFAQALGKERAPPNDCRTRERRANNAEQTGRRARVKDGHATTRRGLTCSQHAGRALDRIACGNLGIEIVGRTAHS
jgi:hypothetical protein